VNEGECSRELLVTPKFYYEDLTTSQVSWDLPIACMSNDALVACVQILTMRGADTAVFIGGVYPGLSVIMRQLDTLDDYLVKTTNTSGISSSGSKSPQDTIQKPRHRSNRSAQVDELPEGWRQVFDKKKNKHFYVNT